MATKNKVLAFGQSSDFLEKIAIKNMDKQKLPMAMRYYRSAFEQQPERDDLRVALACVLSELDMYERSSRLLLPLLVNPGPLSSESAFQMGINQAALGLPRRTANCLSHYLKQCPEGEHAEEAQELLEWAYDAIEEDELLSHAEMLAERANEAMNQEDYLRAKKDLIKALEENPHLLYARNNLAVCNYMLQDIPSAIAETKRVLKEDKNNNFAWCNLLYFTRMGGHEEDFALALQALRRAVPFDEVDAQRIGLALGEAGEHAAAHRLFLQSMHQFSYTASALLFAGIAAYNMGDYRRSRSHFAVLSRRQWENSTAMYYLSLCDKALKGEEVPKLLLYQEDLPVMEVTRRVAYINRAVRESAGHIQKTWQEDSEFRSLALWGIEQPEPSIRRACVEILSICGENVGMLALEDLLLRGEIQDEEKREILTALGRMEKTEPHLALLEGHVVSAKVMPYTMPAQTEAYYQQLIGVLAETMKAKDREHALSFAAMILYDMIVANREEHYKEFDQAAICAAIEFLALQHAGEHVELDEICGEYATAEQQAARALKAICEDMQKDENIGNGESDDGGFQPVI